MVIKEPKYIKLAKLLDGENDNGHNIIWHIKHGGSIYKRIFLFLLMRIEKEQLTTPMYVLKQHLKAPSSALQYPLYKFELEGLIKTSSIVKSSAIVITERAVNQWDELCEQIQKE